MGRNKIIDREPSGKFDRLPLRERSQLIFKESLESLAEFYGFEKIFTSVLEDFRIFMMLQKAGLFKESHPVLVKTNYGSEFFLKPSGILSVLRAYVSHKMNDLPHPLKFSFGGEIFHLASQSVCSRAEWGLAMIGEGEPVAEVQIIHLVWKALEEAGFDMGYFGLRVNAAGCAVCRSSFRSPFSTYLRNRLGRLCKNCKRFFKSMPTRILVCREEKCRMVSSNAPQVLDFLCEACKKHLTGFLEFLDEIRIPYILDNKLFRDNSWFDTLIFEIRFNAVEETEKKDTGENTKDNFSTEGQILGEGGRLVKVGELLTGRRLDAVGLVLSPDALEKIWMSKERALFSKNGQPKVFFVQLGDLAKRKAFKVIEDLRKAGIKVEESLGRDSIKSQLRAAERGKADVALILGQKEALDDTIIVRETELGAQETVLQEKLVEFLKKKLKK